MPSPALCPYCPKVLFGTPGGRMVKHIQEEHPEYANRPQKRHYGALRKKQMERRNLTFSMFGKVCLRCGARQFITIDHVIPLSLGGPDEWTNWQPLCQTCNYIKGQETTDYRKGPIPNV